MIIGTAGHIDHGKTSLVKALTGVDADRLKEEKERGITIDLGFAYKPLAGGGVLGFIDVPGHEKLVRNMLAGATGIDHVLLVVAADDGPMPQTREHLAILDLLGLSRGVVALTKSDLVSAARLSEAEAEIRSMLAGTALAHADVIAVSSATGEGIQSLDRHLIQTAAALPTSRTGGNFRLAVDRCFTLAGIGTVVTGTAISGRVVVGDRLLVSPRGLPVRVRGIHAQNSEAEHGLAGQRCALNLAGSGLEKSDIQRGDWIVATAAHAPTQRIDVRLRLLAGEDRALAHWTPLHLHLGASDVGARVVLLEGAQLEARQPEARQSEARSDAAGAAPHPARDGGQGILPGTSALVQLDLDRPIGALHGDRFIVRDQSALRTLGGGVVIDPFAPKSRRHKAQRLALLAALEAPTPAGALAALLELDLPNGVDLQWLSTAWNLTPDEQQALALAVPHRTVADGKTSFAFAPEQLTRFASRVAQALAGHHQRAPDSPGLTLDQLKRALTVKPQAAMFALLLRELTAAGSVQRSGPYFRLSGHEAALLPGEQKLWEKMRPWLDEAALHPPKLGDMTARDRAIHPAQALHLLLKLSRMGKLYAVSNDYFVLPQHLSELAARAQALAESDPHRRLNIKSLRESTGISRHFSMPLIEFFDRVGFTKRSEDGRHVRRDAQEFFDGHHPPASG